MRSLAFVVLLVACSRTEAPGPQIVASPDTGTSPMLTYEEAGSTFAFWPSGAVRFTKPTRSCDSELGENGNLWTRTDVNDAFEAPEVQAALARGEIYRSSYEERGRLVAAKGTITWVDEWKELPPPEPPAVHHLQKVLHVLLENRASLCQ